MDKYTSFANHITERYSNDIRIIQKNINSSFNAINNITDILEVQLSIQYNNYISIRLLNILQRIERTISMAFSETINLEIISNSELIAIIKHLQLTYKPNQLIEFDTAHTFKILEYIEPEKKSMDTLNPEDLSSSWSFVTEYDLASNEKLINPTCYKLDYNDEGKYVEIGYSTYLELTPVIRIWNSLDKWDVDCMFGSKDIINYRLDLMQSYKLEEFYNHLINCVVIEQRKKKETEEDDDDDGWGVYDFSQEQQEVPAQASVESYSAPTVRVQVLYEPIPSTSQNGLPTPPPTTPQPPACPEPEVSSEVTDPVEGLFLGLSMIQNNYEERLNSLYEDLKSAGVKLVENILEMDQKRKVAVEKLEKIYANISDVRDALKNIREQQKK
ncbi:hypothetical protein FQR65_LT17403 [Abscondita terminalis]|nr:hypothetical protein FQR65_LT17403 [Abscondita terminalis]